MDKYMCRPAQPSHMWAGAEVLDFGEIDNLVN